MSRLYKYVIIRNQIHSLCWISDTYPEGIVLLEAPKIVIAGASGYIGRAIIPKLLERFPNAEITALSRSAKKSDDLRVKWKVCDLFSHHSLETVIPSKVDLAFYLVHSMGPTAHLDQGSFADYDLLLADNFARVIRKQGIQHLIYLGGLIPKNGSMSLHLKSRLEVEETFALYRLPITVFRAGLIVGENGSSFQILLKLVKRIPIMICPNWTQTLTTPVDLSTVLSALVSASLNPLHLQKTYDLAGCKPLTYINMMRETASQMGKKRFFFTIPFFTPTLSRLWVSLITNSPKNLVYPLIQSLQHPMVARDCHLYDDESLKRSYSDLLKNTVLKTQPGKALFHFQPSRKTVRSVQRLVLPHSKNAEWIKFRYLEWLPRFLKPFIKVNLDGNFVVFSVFKRNWIMLQLEFSSSCSDIDTQILYIIKGLIVAENNRGRLEFRVVLNRRYVIAAIHDYCPALPWFIYQQIQARIHLFVMRSFGKELELNFKDSSDSLNL